MKKIGKIILIILSPVILCVAHYIFSVFYFLFPFTDSIVTQGIADDGTEVYVIQAYYNLNEPYRVGLYARYPGGNWRYSYLGHEDPRWREATLEFHQNQVSVFNRGELRETYILPGPEIEINSEGWDGNGYYFPDSCAWTMEEIFQHHSERTDS